MAHTPRRSPRETIEPVYGHAVKRDEQTQCWGKCRERICEGKGREDEGVQDGKKACHGDLKRETARRRKLSFGEGRSSVISATLCDG